MLKRFCATAGPEGTVVLQYSHGFEGCRAFRSWLCSVYPPPDLGMLQDTWLLSLANLQHHGIFLEFLVSGNDCFKLPSWLEFVQVAGARICRLQEGLWGSCPFGCQGADGFLAFFWLIPSQPKMQIMLATFMTGPEWTGSSSGGEGLSL